MARYGMVIDLDRCTGCRACMEACKVENNTPQGSFWMYVFRFEEGEYPNTRVGFMPRPCMHCDNAPCVKVCPVGARFDRQDGLVATDWQRCIGCRYCEVACPYGVNFFNWKNPERNYYFDWNEAKEDLPVEGNRPPYSNPDLEQPSGPERRYVAGGGHQRGIIEKCTFCVHRVEEGLQPTCVEECPVFAMKFGDLDDNRSDASKTLAKKPGTRLMEELGTEPKVFYVGEKKPPSEEAREIEAVPVEVNRGRR